MCAPLFVTRFSHFSQNRVDCCSVRPIIRDPTNSVTDLIADINDGIHQRSGPPKGYTPDQGLGPQRDRHRTPRPLWRYSRRLAIGA